MYACMYAYMYEHTKAVDKQRAWFEKIARPSQSGFAIAMQTCDTTMTCQGRACTVRVVLFRNVILLHIATPLHKGRVCVVM